MADSTIISPRKKFTRLHRQLSALTAVLSHHELALGVFDIGNAGEVGGNFHEKIGVGENLGLVGVDIVKEVATENLALFQ